MVHRHVAVLALALASASPVGAQVPDALSGRLLFQMGTSDAGHETYSVERLPGGYRIVGEVNLEVMNYHIVQHLEVETGERLEFRTAEVRLTVNGEPTTVGLVRKEGSGFQETTQGDSTVAQDIATPESSVLLTSNVIHHIAQFAWLHGGEVGQSEQFVAFPRVPVTVLLEEVGAAELGAEKLSYRRYFLNIANAIGAYVWLADDGTPLKVSVPLQAFVAVSEAHSRWSDALSQTREEPEPDVGAEGAYDAEEATFESEGITLAGTLTTPKGEGPWPAVVLITGSGAQDRDENSPGPGGLKLGIFRTVADSLTRRGIAVLRCDDRGVGGSGGSLAEAGLSGLVADVEAAVGYLRTSPGIDASRVGLIGHSEGGIIAPIVASGDREIAAIVLMAGTAAPIDSVILEQAIELTLAAGGDSADVERARESTLGLMDAIREGREPEDTDLSPGTRRWLREHIEHDPIATIKQVSAPVLIVNGGHDIQVFPEHARRLGAALEQAGHPDYEVRVFPDLNHLFAVSRGGGLAEYVDPDAEVDPEFLSYMADWLVARLIR
jgi:dipeptidyl aminopeptidase/acylaminoacyl peptidase